MPRPKPIWHDAAKAAGISRYAMRARLKSGLTIEQALSVKPKNSRIRAVKYILSGTYHKNLSQEWLKKPLGSFHSTKQGIYTI